MWLYDIIEELPSPAVCCACGLCIMLAGINITVVGALGLTNLVHWNNSAIVAGPVLLLIALLFFGVYCMFSPQPYNSSSRKGSMQNSCGIVRNDGTSFEMEAGEQDAHRLPSQPDQLFMLVPPFQHHPATYGHHPQMKDH